MCLRHFPLRIISYNSYMASIGEVYGTDFQSNATLEKARYNARIFASNIVHKQFSFRNECSDMWDKNNMKPEIIKYLTEQVRVNNPKFRMVYIPKTSEDVNMFPYLINGAVEYFVVTDMSTQSVQLYSIYLTPTFMEAF